MLTPELLSEAIICDSDDSILEVSQIMRDTLARHLIVVDSNKSPLGIISASDIVYRAIACEKECSKTLAKDIMTKDIKCIDISSSLDEIEDLITEEDPHSLPVTKDGKIVGIVEIWKIINLIIEDEKNSRR